MGTHVWVRTRLSLATRSMMSHINILILLTPLATLCGPGDLILPQHANYSDGNALVANNLVSKSTTSLKTTVTLDGDKMTIPYLTYQELVIISPLFSPSISFFGSKATVKLPFQPKFCMIFLNIFSCKQNLKNSNSEHHYFGQDKPVFVKITNFYDSLVLSFLG